MSNLIINPWVSCLENIMKKDSNACAPILSYYLDNINESAFLFCPLGYDLYESVGHQMQTDERVLDAAIETGLMAQAVHTYIGAVLDVYENWLEGCDGLFYLMAHPKLHQFVPYYDRKMAEILRRAESEEEWYSLYGLAKEDVYVESFCGY